MISDSYAQDAQDDDANASQCDALWHVHDAREHEGHAREPFYDDEPLCDDLPLHELYEPLYDDGLLPHDVWLRDDGDRVLTY